MESEMAVTAESKGMGAKPCRVVLVDDHPIVRDGLVQMIKRQSDLAVCGEAGSAEEALRMIPDLEPELVVIDIFLGGMNGIELTKLLHQANPVLPILMLSMHDESLYAERAIRAGANGYVMKQEASRTILEAMRTVLSGKRYVSTAVSEMLGEPAVSGDSAAFADMADHLTPRELGIFEQIGAGKDRNAIAEALNISTKTVETHRANIKYKLNARSAAELLECAKRWVATRRES